MKITSYSHLDHGLPSEIVALISEKYAFQEGFKIETFEIPEGFPSVPCGLIGPATGGNPVAETEVEYQVRGNRPGASRLINREPVDTRKVTVIMGNHEGQTTLYTAFGGPLAPREPFDPSIQDNPELLRESKLFWAQHALCK